MTDITLRNLEQMQSPSQKIMSVIETGMEERFQKMESGLHSHVQEQIAVVRQQTTYQHPHGRG